MGRTGQGTWCDCVIAADQAQDKATAMDACFDFEFVGLPHKTFQSSEFDAAAAVLAARFKQHHTQSSLTRNVQLPGLDAQ